ncbi:hypothetical protein Shal_0769 [Shewanella halifaxensis HAW-EB4]|uniref:Uncharacterized protein n=1 Tax=Shewanella halifaxensis (strain HAW-EB4) TaxID=458817 RepID=B0TTK1_SHEHH|nr:hypothetical protein Shal_0769 [Shewanella halifaxensis HAW-EB4]
MMVTKLKESATLGNYAKVTKAAVSVTKYQKRDHTPFLGILMLNQSAVNKRHLQPITLALSNKELNKLSNKEPKKKPISLLMRWA